VSAELQQLQASLVRLHASGHPLGLSRDRAAGLVRDLEGGVPLPRAAARAGLASDLVAPCVQARVSDQPQALAALMRVLGTVTAHRRVLRSAGGYPLVLAVVIALTGALVSGVMGPALAILPLAAGPSSPALLWSALAGALVALLVLAAAVLGRLSLPWIGSAWRGVEGYAFLAGLEALTGAGATLPDAVCGASVWCRGAARARALALARALNAGHSLPELAPLLSPLETSMLHASARSGALPATLTALVQQRRLALARQVPAQAIRVHTASLVLAGIAMAVVGGGFFSVYSQAVGGG